MSVPLSGRAEYTVTIPIYNNGSPVPQLYCSLLGSILYEDNETGTLFTGTACIADVALVSGVSGLYGSVDKTLTIRGFSDFEDHAREQYSMIAITRCVVCWSFSPYQPFDMWNDIVGNGLWEDISTDLRLMSGYPVGEIIQDSSELSSDPPLAALALKIFQDGISVNNAYATSSDVADIQGILTVPTPPSDPQRNFIDNDSVTRFGLWVGKIIPAVFLVPLIAFIGFTFIMSLLSLLKHG